MEGVDTGDGWRGKDCRVGAERVAGRRLSAIGYRLSVIGYQLSDGRVEDVRIRTG
jgi:hypothetical protein